ncbi:hypothetical protein EJ08DRAFT_674103 [Tothia fuscella]|uniref:BTB domain-containing protein n=1 Tax=Tothia fuscella TaxID=1048955 RepID=A0A9P4U4I0_9PEZI|nr:hypothetical protein EJ08DRAFT_674103 [Tothia fuscella]
MNTISGIGYPSEGTSPDRSLPVSPSRKWALRLGKLRNVESTPGGLCVEPIESSNGDELFGPINSDFRLLPLKTLGSIAKERPKHVPIVIPTYVLPLTPDSQSQCTDYSPRTPSTSSTFENSPSLLEFPCPRRRPSVASSSLDPVSSKARHVEIRIPIWAQPVNSLPDSPVSLPSARSSLKVPQIPASRSSSPVTMARVTPGNSRTSTMDSTISVPPSDQYNGGPNLYSSRSNGSHPSLYQYSNQDPVGNRDGQSRTPASATHSTGPSPALQQTAGLSNTSTNSGLSGLVCNVHRTTGREPRPLVGATTTILGDKLYVFGGRKLSRTRPQLSADLYELDLIHRHWTKIDATGDKPPPRYFHSVCALGDTKLVCYGGMSPAILPNGQPTIPNQQVNPQDPQPEVVVMSDIHIYDVPTRSWKKVPSADSPQGRYAHCASILPSSSSFSSANASLSAIHHNPSSAQAPNSGTIGVQLDGNGGAEMVVVGGQDSANHYIEQISVFNLRSLKWTATSMLGRSCGAYRSVTAPLSAAVASKIGTAVDTAGPDTDVGTDPPSDGASAMLIYSNYNFLDVKLELQVRLPDGSLIEKPMQGNFSPPGLRFPNGGIIDNHFVVSGTFLTSSKQEYALWALDLKRLTWSRIDAGASTFSHGSWNRGVLWSRRNTFVILGNRRRSLVEDYNHRRINFANLCMVELEAFGLYDNPRKRAPMSAFASASAPSTNHMPNPDAGGRQVSKPAEDLGQMAMGLIEFSDMDFIAMNGERVPANSYVVAHRWGPYFHKLLVEGMTTTDTTDTATLRPGTSITSRHSALTITPSISSGYSQATTLQNSRSSSDATSTGSANQAAHGGIDIRNVNPALRPRSLYLPHTTLTIQALLHYLYTSSVPPPSSPLCTPQILCSLLQLARPYKVDGLLEAVVERLHAVLDNRNTAAIFNAAAMAAGGGSGVTFFNHSLVDGTSAGLTNGHNSQDPGQPTRSNTNDAQTSLTAQGLRELRINTEVASRRPGTAMSSTSEDEPNSAGGVSDAASSVGGDGRSNSMASGGAEMWAGELSSVVGLQKRGLRGLMEGRRIRELVREGNGAGSANATGDRVGLGIV